MFREGQRKVVQYFRAGLGGLRDRLLYQYKLPGVYDSLSRARSRLFGSELRIEAASLCQLRCPVCETGSGRNRTSVIGAGWLRFDDFRAVVDANPHIRAIDLSSWGEIFLNPQLLDIIRHAHECGIRLEASVNLNDVSDDVLEALVKYRFHCLKVALDGASRETYAIYRVRGDFDKVLGNVKRIIRLKRRYLSPLPKLIWQFVIFGHNEHEIPQARRMAAELGMPFLAKLNGEQYYSPVNDEDLVRRESGLGVASRNEFTRKSRKAYVRPCNQLWDAPQINWDGRLLGCCVNVYGDFGNVFESGLRALLNGERYRYAKRMILGLEPAREDVPCFPCKIYRAYVLGEKIDSLGCV